MAMISVQSGVAYLCQYGLPFLGGQDWGFFFGYLIPTIMMAVGVCVFVSGSKNYKHVKPRGSMLSMAGGILVEALWTRHSFKSPTGFLLDKASSLHGGSYAQNDVEGMKYVAKLAPFLGVMIPYWGIYGQTKTAFQIQGCQMDSELGGFQLPISAMNIFNNVAILILVPLCDQYFFPMLKEKGYNLSMLNKIGIGFFFATLAMVTAALIEMYRLQQAPDSGSYDDDSAKDHISPCRYSALYPHSYSLVAYTPCFAETSTILTLTSTRSGTRAMRTPNPRTAPRPVTRSTRTGCFLWTASTATIFLSIAT